MLLIEGADLLGKTTFAKKVVNELTTNHKEPVAYLKMGMESVGKHTVRFLRSRINPWTVADRMHLSDVIYAWHARNENVSQSATEFARINELIVAKAGMLVIFYANEQDYTRIVESTWRDVEAYRKDQCVRVNRAYRELAMTHELRWREVHKDSSTCQHILTKDLVVFDSLRIISVKITCNAVIEGIEYIDDAFVKHIAHEYSCAQKRANFGLEI